MQGVPGGGVDLAANRKGAAPLPAEILGPRLCLRPFLAADAPAVWEAIAASLDHLAPWLPWADQYRSEEDVLDYLLRARAIWEQQVDLPLGIFHREDGRFLGGTGLHRVDWEQRHFEIGYWLRASEVGKGYAREAVRLLTRLAFRDLAATRVEIRVRPDNAPSRRVAESVGFPLVGSAPPRESDFGETGELLIYALDPAAFRALPWSGAPRRRGVAAD
jgi:RimJ/RimL family protein N-acetyltransferase